MPTMWTLVKWLPGQQRLEKPQGFLWGGGGTRVRLRPGDTGGGRWDAGTCHHPPPRLETPSRSGPGEPCCARGQPHVVTGDTCPRCPGPTARWCVTSGRCHQPTDFVTSWTGGDRHPVAPVDSHSSWELGRTQTHPPSGPRPPPKELSGPGCLGGRGDSGAGSICRKHGYLQCFIFKPSFSQTVAAVGRGWVEQSLEPPMLLEQPEGCAGCVSPAREQTQRD